MAILTVLKGFGYGLYDGISGLVTQPMRGAEKEGAAGLFKGIGKGIGGLILKPGAAIWGLPGYSFLGIHKEIRKLFGSSVLNYIISARTAGGYEDFRTSTLEERHDIIARWNLHKTEFQSPKQNLLIDGPDLTATGHLSPKGFMQTRHLSFDERKKLHEERKAKRDAERDKVQSKDGKRSCPFCRRNEAHTHTPRTVQQTAEAQDDASLQTLDEFEEAIRASVVVGFP